MQYRIEQLPAQKPTYAEQHEAGEKLAKDMLSAVLHLPTEEIHFFCSETGKPYVKGHTIHFSVSHSGDRVFCAVHKALIGADIQKILPLRQKVIQRVCTPAEIAYIGNDPTRFTEVWTRKEAYAKLTGKGLAIGLQSIVVADENGLFSGINGHAVLTEKQDGYIYSVIWEDNDHAT